MLCCCRLQLAGVAAAHPSKCMVVLLTGGNMSVCVCRQRRASEIVSPTSHALVWRLAIAVLCTSTASEITAHPAIPPSLVKERYHRPCGLFVDISLSWFVCLLPCIHLKRGGRSPPPAYITGAAHRVPCTRFPGGGRIAALVSLQRGAL